jgi:hypothetical protein
MGFARFTSASRSGGLSRATAGPPAAAVDGERKQGSNVAREPTVAPAPGAGGSRRDVVRRVNLTIRAHRSAADAETRYFCECDNPHCREKIFLTEEGFDALTALELHHEPQVRDE